MPNNKQIQFLRKDGEPTPEQLQGLLAGQPLFDSKNGNLYIGKGNGEYTSFNSVITSKLPSVSLKFTSINSYCSLCYCDEDGIYNTEGISANEETIIEKPVALNRPFFISIGSTVTYCRKGDIIDCIKGEYLPTSPKDQYNIAAGTPLVITKTYSDIVELIF